MWKSAEGSTKQLIQFCLAYFITYVITGVVVRYFQFYSHGPMLNDIQYLTYSTIGGSGFAILVVMILRWYKIKSINPIKWGKITIPGEILYITPSGICTTVIILFTTLMYSIKGVSVMVAMVLMRAGIIIVSRLVDLIQAHQGLLHKKVYWQENMGVIFALIAVSTKMFWGVFVKGTEDFNFLAHPLALTVLLSYIAAYGIRIYIMNYFKNTRPKGVPYDNKGYFGVEQIVAFITMMIVALVLFNTPVNIGAFTNFHMAIVHPPKDWGWVILAGVAYGLGAFFSVFIFLFKGRTATFAGLTNRLTSLVAGTAATLIVWMFMNGGFPQFEDWLSLVFVFTAIGFISFGERRRIRELKKTHEIANNPK